MPPAALVDGIPKALKAPLNQHRGSIRLLLAGFGPVVIVRSEEHTSELQSPCNLVCRLLLEKKKNPADAFAYVCLVRISYVSSHSSDLMCVWSYFCPDWLGYCWSSSAVTFTGCVDRRRRRPV